MRDDGSAFMMDFMSTSEGLELSRAFVRIGSAKLRRKVVELVRVLGRRTGLMHKRQGKALRDT